MVLLDPLLDRAQVAAVVTLDAPREIAAGERRERPTPPRMLGRQLGALGVEACFLLDLRRDVDRVLDDLA